MVTVRLAHILLIATVSVALADAQGSDLGQTRIPASAVLPSGSSSIKDGFLESKEGEVGLTVGDSTYTIQNGKQILEAVKQNGFPLPLHLQTSSPKGAGKYYIKMTDFMVRSVGEWKVAMSSNSLLRNHKELKDLRSAMEGLSLKTRSYLNEGVKEDWTAVASGYEGSKVQLEGAYSKIEDPVARADLALLKANLLTEEALYVRRGLSDAATNEEAKNFVDSMETVEKRFYQLNDNYRPEIYPLISRCSETSVAIVKKAGGSAPVGTAVLIGDNLVLTARHNIGKNCAKTFEQSEYVIWTDFEERRFSPIQENIVCETQEVYRSENLDFCLMEVRRAVDKQPVSRAPATLTLSRIVRWTPIFLVGYPQGNRRTVHDGSWVLFPHRLANNREWGEIESSVTAEFLEEGTDPQSDVRKMRAATKAREFMISRYGDFDPTEQREYVLNWELQEYIGIESDTFQGDSGAPAMMRDGGGIIGILYRGGVDTGTSASTDERNPAVAARPGARFHERLLPIGKIVAELDEKLPGWRTKWNVVSL